MRAYIALGSNLGNPQTQLQRAVDALALLPGSVVVVLSPVYQSPPMYLPSTVGTTPAEQPDYLNAVVCLDTPLAPLSLLDALQDIEYAQGRLRGERWAARTLDLDLLLYGDLELKHERLTLPHPGLPDRQFVLQPLADIAPTLILPDGRRISELLSQCTGPRLIRTGTLQSP